MNDIEHTKQEVIHIDITDLSPSCAYSQGEMLRELKEERLFIENQQLL